MTLLFSFFLEAGAEEETLKTKNALYEEMASDICEWKTSSVYYSSFEPRNLEIENIRNIADDEHYIAANCLYNISWTYQKIGNEKYEIEMKFRYYMSEGEYGRVKRECEKIAEEVEEKSEYEKIKYAHDYLIISCEYSYSSNGPYNCLFKGKACCNGYALAFQMIMDECEIPCRYVANSSHAWNAVYLDGQWYNIDVTWDDVGGMEIGYDYFLKSNKDFPNHPGADATALASYDLIAGKDDSEITLIYIKSLTTRYWPILLLIVAGALFLLIKIITLNIEEKGKKNDFEY